MNIFRRFFSWIWKRFFAPKKLTRRTTRYEHAGGDVDALDHVDETVRLSGTLTLHGKREIRRDPRLLPKPGKRNPYEKPPRVMSRKDARRLFSTTMRTRDRNIRDLLADASQLERYGLPKWEAESDIAGALGISVSELRHFSIHKFRDTTSHYVTFAVPKRSGGERLIMAPKKRLKRIQRSLLRDLVSKLPAHDAAHGFVAGRSTRSAAAPHVGRRFVIRMDLKDFFPSVTFARVRGYLIALGYGFEVATVLSVLMTEPERQPVMVQGKRFLVPVGHRYCVQGAPTSPGLCNGIAHKLDARLAGLAESLGVQYTRYADDLSFSGDEIGLVPRLLRVVPQIVVDEGFEVNEHKTRVMRSGGRQEVVGVSVNETLGLSRKKRRVLRARIHRLAQGEVPASQREQEIAELEGWVAYVHMLNADQAKPLREALARESSRWKE